FSFEIKTSSQKSIYGNRSYAKSDTGKDKAGYYLTINFEKISANDPRILLIQMGWLDHSDWLGQKSETGQQASLAKGARDNKLIVLYRADSR
ncbi:MAG: ScaI family restriction endonuclease, partial [Clostridiales bacterium]|nr:ScaI family restriction endonuclease [Clostridiales bacterium]